MPQTVKGEPLFPVQMAQLNGCSWAQWGQEGAGKGGMGASLKGKFALGRGSWSCLGNTVMAIVSKDSRGTSRLWPSPAQHPHLLETEPFFLVGYRSH